MEDTLRALCSLGGPSGFEGAVAERAAELLSPLVDQVCLGRLGEVVGVRRCGRPNARRLLLDAHLDEIGFLVTGIEEGYLRFQTIGGVDPRMLPAGEVTVLTRPPIPGVITAPEGGAGEERSLPVEELRIDIGMSQEEALCAVPVGTPVTYRGGCFPLGEGRLCGKALDDRSCFAVLLRTLELLRERELPVDLYILGSVCEETNGAGAIVATYGIAPELCVAVDVTFGATPDSPEDKTFPLGAGPTIGVGPSMARWMSRRLAELARREGIPFQREVMSGSSGTNAWHMQISREGVATAVVSLPLRYMHSPIEVVDREDMEHTARLLAAFVADLEEGAEVW